MIGRRSAETVEAASSERLAGPSPLDPPPPPEPDRGADHRQRQERAQLAAPEPRRGAVAPSHAGRGAGRAALPSPTPPKPRPTSELACWSSRSAVAARPGSLRRRDASPPIGAAVERTRRSPTAPRRHQGHARRRARRRARPAPPRRRRPRSLRRPAPAPAVSAAAPRRMTAKVETRITETKKARRNLAWAFALAAPVGVPDKSRRVPPMPEPDRPPDQDRGEITRGEETVEPRLVDGAAGREQDSADVGEQALDPRQRREEATQRRPVQVDARQPRSGAAERTDPDVAPPDRDVIAPRQTGHNDRGQTAGEIGPSEVRRCPQQLLEEPAHELAGRAGSNPEQATQHEGQIQGPDRRSALLLHPTRHPAAGRAAPAPSGCPRPAGQHRSGPPPG